MLFLKFFFEAALVLNIAGYPADPGILDILGKNLMSS